MGKEDGQFQISNAEKVQKQAISYQDTAYRQSSTANQEATRQQSTYHLTKEFQLKDLDQTDRRTKHQKKYGLYSVRQTIKDKIQRYAYKNYDRAVLTGDMQSQKRTLRLHHALGQKFADGDKNVLEIDCAGSGFDYFRKEYTGFHGKYSDDLGKSLKEVKERAQRLAKFAGMDETQTKALVDSMVTQEESRIRAHLDQVYGQEHQDALDKKTKFSYRKKSKTSTSTGRDITSYTLSGPVKSFLGKKGAFDSGEYQISHTKDYVLTMAQDYIYNHLVNGQLDHDIVINLQGHSRGGVSAGIAAHVLSEWLNSPEGAQFKGKVKINLIQRDAVPGTDSRIAEDHAKMDLRIPAQGGGYQHDPDLNVTSLVSYHTEHTFCFVPQEVRGQQRIVVMQDKHGVGLDSGDGTQTDANGETKWHETAGIDAATMQAYRGSGYSELGNGIWLMDEDNVMVRMRSYGEAMDVLRKVASKTVMQQDRKRVVARMIKNWFVDNEFVDDQITAEEHKSDLRSKTELEDELAKASWGVKPSKEMKKVQEATARLQTFMSLKCNSAEEFEALKRTKDAALDDAIQACREYMDKKDPITVVGEEHLEKVSKLLSIYRQEKYFLGNLNGMTFAQYQQKGSPTLGSYGSWLI